MGVVGEGRREVGRKKGKTRKTYSSIKTIKKKAYPSNAGDKVV